MLEKVREWRVELGGDLDVVMVAVLKLWEGERSEEVLLAGLAEGGGGVGGQLLRHVLRLITTEVARAVEEHTAKEQAALLQHDRFLRTVALVACAPPGAEESSLDQTKCLQASTDLEETGVRLFDSVLAIFTGEREISTVGRGLDRTDQALTARILSYIALGSDQMHGDGWDDIDIDTIIGGHGSGNDPDAGGFDGPGYGSGSSGYAHSGGAPENKFWSLVESRPLVDRLGRTHQPKDLGLRSKAAIGVFFSGHWCPPSREFTPDLIDAYDHWARQKGFEILFCSSDQTEEEFHDYLGEMPWKARVSTNSDDFKLKMTSLH